jgi:hypothetical protein
MADVKIDDIVLSTLPTKMFDGGDGGHTVFQIQVFDSSDADFNDLYEKFDCIDLALALSGSVFLGSNVLAYSRDMWLTVDNQNQWDQIMKWLDTHVEEYQIRFFPFLNDKPRPEFPVFWRKKSQKSKPKYTICPHMNQIQINSTNK